jgi:flagellar basal body rod protein FlgG
MVTQQGYPVLYEGNSPVKVDPSAGHWEIDSAGYVSQNGSRLALQIVKPASLGDLTKVGENLFRATNDLRPVADKERSVASGSLEGSAIQPTTEMTSLIETSRILEANINVMKTHNEMLQGLVERILKA